MRLCRSTNVCSARCSARTPPRCSTRLPGAVQELVNDGAGRGRCGRLRDSVADRPPQRHLGVAVNLPLDGHPLRRADGGAAGAAGVRRQRRQCRGARRAPRRRRASASIDVVLIGARHRHRRWADPRRRAVPRLDRVGRRARPHGDRHGRPAVPGELPQPRLLRGAGVGHGARARGAPDRGRAAGLGARASRSRDGRELDGPLVTELAHDGDLAACAVLELIGSGSGVAIASS